LPRQIQPADAKMDVSVDEAGRHRPIAKIDDFRTIWAGDRVRHFGDGIVFDQDLRRPAYRVA
jgi:hypothetical protein